MATNRLLQRTIFLVSFISAILVSSVDTARAQGSDGGATFDMATGNAATEVIIPNIIPGIADLSPRFGDATLVLRFTTLITNAWFDAIAPYHPTAVGVYSRLGRRPAVESADNTNMNTALIYASYEILKSMSPSRISQWNALLQSVGLDPFAVSTDESSPIYIGQQAGRAIVEFREQDGMNQLGDHGGKQYNLMPYEDYTGFIPSNPAEILIFPSKWQPAITSNFGVFKVQKFVTPQLRNVIPYSVKDPSKFKAPFPYASQFFNFGAYKRQAQNVLDASAELDDERKMISELFDNKIRSLGFSSIFASQSTGQTLVEWVQYDFLANVAAFDTAIIIWKEKARFNAVRPHSAIEFLWRDKAVTAWGGPGRGTVNDIPAADWTSYLPVADHPEYPSASASFCAAHAEASRLFLGSDNLGFTVATPAGSSFVEPGVTPAADMTLVFPTWSDFEYKCGISRFWSGVHFEPSIPAGQAIGHEVAKIAYDFVKAHISGNVD